MNETVATERDIVHKSLLDSLHEMVYLLFRSILPIVVVLWISFVLRAWLIYIIQILQTVVPERPAVDKILDSPGITTKRIW